MGGLKPWREVVTPHPDVASGRFTQAEFAADLAQVLRGDAAREYGDPEEFFRRTYLTEGLHRLLLNGLRRVSGQGGDPVIELQTNFGGGKTHSMLALYHLFSGVPADRLSNVDALLSDAEVEEMPEVRRAVLVGTALSAGQTRTKPDGTEVRTLWGEMAWQLLKKDGYKVVAESDRHGVNPGSDVLHELFQKASPCLILIDEWVAYFRQLYESSGLPGGSFDANLSFAQALTEAARAVPRTLIVASLPQSNIEIGGEGGKQALALLENTFGRLETNWRPASQDESYEIVRRRLFEPMVEPTLHSARDAVVRAFMELYNQQSGEFPAGSQERDYERQLELTYPIHPELFERLYSDWASLEEFQQTRGVLRLMAAAIHALGIRDDRSLMIMPSSMPMDDPQVQEELTRSLPPNWVPVIEKDVDGAQSLPWRLDQENPNLGRYSACRRVMRTIYMGSAPTSETVRKGVDDRRVKLGCVQPGESVPIFGDALRRLSDQATHLYGDGTRYWFSTQPSVNRLAQDRAAQQSEDKVIEEIVRRLREEKKSPGKFASVHPCPSSSSEVLEESECRLVILNPEKPHLNRAKTSPALDAAGELLENRGSGPRLNRNTLVFLAADNARRDDLTEAVRTFLAWKSIFDERGPLGLDPLQTKLTKSNFSRSNDAVEARIPETYQWLLVPTQPDPKKPVEWQAIRSQGQDKLAVRASKRLINEGLLYKEYAGALLRMELDRIPLWRGDHVSVKQLCEDFARYLYLPRIKNDQVLLQAIQDGMSLLNWKEEAFAYADSYDADRGSYLGLKAGGQTSVIKDSQCVLVKSEVANRHLDVQETDRISTLKGGSAGTGGGDGTGTAGGTAIVKKDTKPRRFYGSVSLTDTRLGLDAGKIAEEVLHHLTELPEAKADITLEIQIEIPDGVPEAIVRTVMENCRTLKFESQGFEEGE